MKIISLEKGLIYWGNDVLSGIQCYDNGAFTLETTASNGNKSIFLYSRDGKSVYQTMWAKKGVVLNDGKYILFDEKLHHCFETGMKVSGSSSSGTMYAYGGKKVKDNFEDFKVFKNGWYMLVFKEEKQLYDDKHHLVASGFYDCEVFENYYAIRRDSILYKYGNWDLCLLDGTLVTQYHNVERLFGDGIALICDLEQKKHYMERPDGTTCYKEAEKFGVVKTETFENGNFVLTDERGVATMFCAGGYQISESTKDALYMPDGRFLQFDKNMVVGLYRENGLIEDEGVLSAVRTDAYYFLRNSEGIKLYNIDGGCLGDGYTLVNHVGHFALMKTEEKFWLFSQFGPVWQMPVK